MFEEHLLPTAARLVHIGPPKTGTTAMQSAFVQVRGQLHEHGVHYAGRGSRPKLAVSALTGAGVPRRDRPPMSAWHELADEVRSAGDLRVCISNEQFATADDDQAATVVADLGGERAHILMVVRPLGALLPSQWQQRVRKKRNMDSYDVWLREVLGDHAGESNHDHFWQLHDLAAQLDRWSAVADPGRVTVVVSDEGNRELLPRLFEGLLGLPEGLLVPAVDRSNRSLDLVEAELVRSLDRVAREHDWPRDVYTRDVKETVSRFLRSRPKERSVPITLPGWATERVAELDAARVATLRDTPVRVVGDPAALSPGATAPGVVDPTPPPEVSVPVETAAGLAGAIVEALLQREAPRQGAPRAEQPGSPGLVSRAASRLHLRP